jgi:anti-anti-sigma regulatory factor/anti-sigma regulatory factor (Ser/Thr protein kinase)
VRRYPTAVLEVEGVLRGDTAPVLRAAVVKLLAEQPSAVVLDVSGVEVAEDLAVTVFGALAQHAAAAEPVALLLAAPSPSLAGCLDRLGVHRFVPVHADRAGALAAAARRPVPPRVRHAFWPDRAELAVARRLVARTCAGWNLAPVGATAVQVANELVTNAVEHAGTAGVLLLTRGDRYLHVAVRDASAVRPALRRPGPYDGGGHGLPLVDALSAGWGTRMTLDGKVVWATLRLRPEL